VLHEKRLTSLNPITQVGLTALLLLVAGCRQNREHGGGWMSNRFMLGMKETIR
jgi:hypothetical protein